MPFVQLHVSVETESDIGWRRDGKTYIKSDYVAAGQFPDIVTLLVAAEEADPDLKDEVEHIINQKP